MSGSLSFGVFSVRPMSSPPCLYVGLRFLFLLFSTTSSFVFTLSAIEAEFFALLKSATEVPVLDLTGALLEVVV